MSFLFEIGQKVKVRATDEVGTVKRRDTADLNIPYYEIDFAGSTTRRVAEKDLWPA